MKTTLAGLLLVASACLLAISAARADSPPVPQTEFARTLEASLISDAEFDRLLARMRFVNFSNDPNVAGPKARARKGRLAAKEVGLMAQRTREIRSID